MVTRPGDGQEDLFDASAHRRVGRVEAAVARSVKAAELDELDAGLAALAVESARAVDVASRKGDPYGVATASRELREALARLRLDPSSRGAGVSAGAAEFLANLGPT